jgi:hypothetical protein
MKPWVKKLLIFGFVGLLAGVFAIWYIFNEKFTDTKERETAFIVNANNFIKEFETNDSLANKKYTEKIIAVTGSVSEIEEADSIVNIKMIDTTTQSYIIFAFQEAEMAKTKKIKQGDNVTIKGSCSGGIYSDILEAQTINFKRCILTN